MLSIWKRFICLTMIATISAASAGNAWFQPATVTRIVLHDFGKVHIYLQGGIKTTEPCSSKTMMVLDPDYMHFREMYSALLAALHAKTQVSGWVNGCDSQFNAPILTRLDVYSE